jgi:hypothetical protein
MLRGGGLIRIDSAAVVDAAALSVTFTVKFDVPAVVGGPEIVLPVRFNPAGSVPFETDQVYGGVPPIALSPCEYATPTVPAGNDDVVILKGGVLIRIDSAAVVDAAALSVTFTMKFDVPAVVGGPEIVLPVRFNPAGSVPFETDQMYGGVPPVALSPCEYATPTVPADNDDVVMLNGGVLIRIDSAAVVDAAALSVTFTVKFDVPAVVGGPEIVLPERLNPAGSVPLVNDHVYGGVPPVALSPCEYATPTVPAGNDDVVMLSGGA